MAALVFVGIAGCSRQPKEYLIGAAGPLDHAYGVQNQHGIDLAVAEINRAGGIKGVPLRVMIRNDHASGAEAASIAGDFVANPRVVAVIGHAGSGAEVSAAHVYDGGHLAAIATTASSPDITGVSPWIFRMISSDSVNGVTLARFASRIADSLHRPLRVGVLYQNDAYGRGLADAFLRSFHGDVINTDPIGETTSVEPYIAYFKQQKPDLVFVASDEDVGLHFVREASRQNLNTTFLGGDGWQGIVVDSASRGAFVGTPFTAQSADTASRRFAAEFRSKYGKYPDAHAALAYDATRLVAQAIGHSDGSREQVRSYIAGLTSQSAFHGLSGPTWFSNSDPIGDTFRITRVNDGMMIPVAAR